MGRKCLTGQRGDLDYFVFEMLDSFSWIEGQINDEDSQMNEDNEIYHEFDLPIFYFLHRTHDKAIIH